MKRTIRVVFGLSAAVLLAREAGAASGSWTATGNGTTGYWTNSANWSSSPYPGSGAGETATLTKSAAGSYTTILDTTPANALSTLTLGAAGDGGTFNLIVTNGATLLTGSEVDIGYSASGDQVTVAGGATWNLQNQILGLGAGWGATAKNNVLTINGGIVTNVGDVYIGRPVGFGGGPSNRVEISNGGQFYGNSSIVLDNWGGGVGNWFNVGGAGAPSTVSVSGAIGLGNLASMTVTNANLWSAGLSVGGSSTLRVYANSTWNLLNANQFYGINGDQAVGSSVTIDGGVLTNVYGISFGWHGAIGNSFQISNGARVYSSGGLWFGTDAYAYPVGSSNTFTVGGAGAPSYMLSSGSRCYVGGNYNTMTVTNATFNQADNWVALPNGIGSTIQVLAGGTFITPQLDIGGTSNNAVLVDGGQLTIGSGGGNVNGTAMSLTVRKGGTVEANSLSTTGSGSFITNSGGIYQFTIASPTIAPNNGFGNIALNNGTVSFRAVANADVLCNRSGKPLDSAAKMAWAGTNAFRLNNATNVASGQTYTFTDTMGPTNFARLELLNGSLYRGGDVTVGAHGILAVSNGVSTIVGNLTFDPTATLSVDLSSTNGYGALVAQGIVDLHGCALQVNLGAAPVPGSSFTILTNSGGYTTNAFAAGSQVVTVNNTNYIVRVRTTSSGATATCNLLTQGMCLIIE